MTKIACKSPFGEGYIKVFETPNEVNSNVGVIMLANYFGEVPQEIPNGIYTMGEFRDQITLAKIEKEIRYLKRVLGFA
jgi:hypothetical protein